MTIPIEAVSVPDVVRELAGDGLVTPAWRNELGGLTFRVDPVADAASRAACYVKWMPFSDRATTERVDLDNEAARMRWAAPYTPVPHVLDVGADDEAKWLVTAAMSASSAVDPRWLAEPETAARAIGAGLRALHDVLPVDECPWTWSIEDRIAVAEDRAARGHAADGWSLETRARLAEAPEHDRLVVCHGDACAPNTLIDDDGGPPQAGGAPACEGSAPSCGHVDLGDLGVADRWADLAVATLSLSWNYLGSWDGELLDAYGVDPDPARIEYYRRLWNAGDISSH